MTQKQTILEKEIRESCERLLTDRAIKKAAELIMKNTKTAIELRFAFSDPRGFHALLFIDEEQHGGIEEIGRKTEKEIPAESEANKSGNA